MSFQPNQPNGSYSYETPMMKVTVTSNNPQNQPQNGGFQQGGFQQGGFQQGGFQQGGFQQPQNGGFQQQHGHGHGHGHQHGGFQQNHGGFQQNQGGFQQGGFGQGGFQQGGFQQGGFQQGGFQQGGFQPVSSNDQGFGQGGFQHGGPQIPNILGAAYGKGDVTEIVRGMVQGGKLEIKAENGKLPDSWVNTHKSLVVVYQYQGSAPQVAACKEGESVNLSQHNNFHWNQQFGALTVLGAAYGPVDVTAKVAQRIQNNKLQLSADDNTLGNTWPNMPKTLVVVYQDAYGVHTSITVQNEHLVLPQLTILGAAWGKGDVTEQVRAMVKSGNLTIKAENGKLPDSWWGVLKSLTIVYQIPGCRPQIASCKEGMSVTLSAQESYPWVAQNGALTILGATYGSADVTEKLAQRIQNNTIDVAANDQTLGDPWQNNEKSLHVVYQDATGIHTKIVNQNDHFKVLPKPIILGAAWGKGDVTEQVRAMVNEGSTQIKAENGKLPDTWNGVSKSLVIVYQFPGLRPEIAIGMEGSTVTLAPTHNHQWNAQHGAFTVLGAAWGLLNVTDHVSKKVQWNKLDLKVESSYLGDGWMGNGKTFVIVYQNQHGHIQTVVGQDGQQLSLC